MFIDSLFSGAILCAAGRVMMPGPKNRKRKRQRRRLNGRAVLCVIVDNGGRAVAICGSEYATFR
jgi:hypothetical protein